MWQARIGYKKKLAATITIQKNWRSHKQQKLFKVTLQNIILVQSVVRCHLAVQRFKRMKQAATLIQAQWRGFASRRTYKHDVTSVVKIQSLIRR
jgi:hypothetical protein